MVVVPATLPPLLPQLPEPEADDYAPSLVVVVVVVVVVVEVVVVVVVVVE